MGFMGRGLLFLTAILWAFHADGSVKITRDGDKLVYEFTVEDIRLSRATIGGKSFVQTKLVGVDGYEGIRYVVGQPEIPVVRFYVEGDGDIRILDNGGRSMNAIAMPWKPNVEAVAKYPGQRAVVTIDPAMKAMNGFFPLETTEIEDAGSVRGVTRRLVTLYPLRIEPSTGKMQLVTEFRVTVPTAVVPPLAKTIAFVVGKKFVGHEALGRYEKFKIAQGFKVKWVHADGDNAKPEGLRKTLRALYTAPDSLGYVLIIGDNEDVAGFKTGLLKGVTDHYYSSLDKENYSSDIGSPDVGVGRLSPATADDLTVIVDKHLKYDAKEFADKKWLGYHSFLASDDGSFWQIAEGSLNYGIDNYTSKKGYLGDFPKMNFVGGDKLYAVTHKVQHDDVMAQLRAGRSFINYAGHGWYDFWDSPSVTVDDVKSIQHNDALPFVASHACLTAMFVRDSFAEAWQRHKFGAIFFWGSMDSSYWDEDDILQRKMYDVMYKENKLEFSDITDRSLEEVWRHYGGAGKSKYYWETYHSFGDPSMHFQTR